MRQAASIAVVLLSLPTSQSSLATDGPRRLPATSRPGLSAGTTSPHDTESFETIARRRPRDMASTARFLLDRQDRARAKRLLSGNHDPLGWVAALAERKLSCTLDGRARSRVTGLVFEAPLTVTLTGGFNTIVERKLLLGHRMRLSPEQDGNLLLEVAKLTGRRVFSGCLVLHPTFVGGHRRELIDFRGTEQRLSRARQRPWNGFYPCIDVESDRAKLDVFLLRLAGAAEGKADAGANLRLVVNTDVDWIHGETPDGADPFKTTRIRDQHALTLLGAQISDRP